MLYADNVLFLIHSWNTLYPIYFDKDRTLEQGRRVPKALGSTSPTVNDVAMAAKQLGFHFEVEASRSKQEQMHEQS